MTLRAIVLVAAALLASAADAAGSTLLYYRLEGNLADASGGGHTGAVVAGGAAYSASVPANPVPQNGLSNAQSFSFDGSTVVSAGNLAAYDFAGAFTLEVWVKTTGSFNRILSRDDMGAPSPREWVAMRSGDASSGPSFHVNDGSTAITVVSSVTIADDAWHHVAATRDASGFLRIYVDGALRGTSTSAVTGTVNPSAPFTIGAYQVYTGERGEYYTGLADEVRISDVELAPDQFLNASGGSPVPEPAGLALAAIGTAAAVASLRVGRR